jgi:hypothetical protein
MNNQGLQPISYMQSDSRYNTNVPFYVRYEKELLAVIILMIIVFIFYMWHSCRLNAYIPKSMKMLKKKGCTGTPESLFKELKSKF